MNEQKHKEIFRMRTGFSSVVWKWGRCRLAMGVLVVWVLGASGGCLVNSACFSDADCPSDRVCVMTGAEGTCEPGCEGDRDCPAGQICGNRSMCVAAECVLDDDCGAGYACETGRCRVVPTQELVCPDDMAAVDRSFCMDRYEASRADATEVSAGRDGSVAVSASGVMPWQVQDNATATEACRAAGKALCTADQWYRACSSSQSLAYSYGNTYDPLTCNGIDAFCYCDTGVCAETAVCPYPHCYGTCGAAFRVMPTGSFPDCVNVDGIYDLNGNLWEHVADGDDRTVRGGAFNCMNSERLHHCTYVPGNWAPSARGFRCCSPGTLVMGGEAEDVDEADGADEADGDGNGGDA